MEVVNQIQREYDPAHPNYKRWQKARDISDQRAEFVHELLSQKFSIENLLILDIGAGEGSTSKLFSNNNFVVSLEPKSERIKKIAGSSSLKPLMADCLNIPFRKSTFDLIILQDVLEHLSVDQKLIEELNNILKVNGIIYLSTPNKLSLFNIISDPHWGIPLLCLFRREQIKKYFLKYFRKKDFSRPDIAELLSLQKLVDLFENDFVITINTKYSTRHLVNDGKGLVWSGFHLRLIKLLKFFGLSRIILKITNDNIGLINKYFTPTFYIILARK